MAQAVAAQALARAGTLLGDQALLDAADARVRLRAAAALALVAGEALGRALQLRPRAGAERAAPGRAFGRRLRERSPATPPRRRWRRRLTDAARRLLPRFDTGYWSLYSLHGDESPLDYHDYVIGLLRKLATRTGDAAWQEAADRFQAYESEPPVIRLRGDSADGLPAPGGRIPGRCADPVLAVEGLDGDADRRREARHARRSATARTRSSGPRTTSSPGRTTRS